MVSSIPRWPRFGSCRWCSTVGHHCGAPPRSSGCSAQGTGHDGSTPIGLPAGCGCCGLGWRLCFDPKSSPTTGSGWLTTRSKSGSANALVILGIRLSDLPEGRPLCHQDMELIALVPMTSSTKHTVAVCLENAVAQTGVPRAILDDHGADLHGGVGIFREAHPETSEFYDVKHKAACLLKARLRRTRDGKRTPANWDRRSSPYSRHR